MAPPYRVNVLCPVLNGIPIIADLDHPFSRFPKIASKMEILDESGRPRSQNVAFLHSNQQVLEELNILYWAYSPDKLWCIAIIHSRNQNVITDLISNFGLKVKSHEEADKIADGWPKNNPNKCGDIPAKLITPRQIDSTTVEVTTECCVGCNYNPDGKNSLVVTLRKEAELPDFPKTVNKQVKDVFLDKSETLSRLVLEHTNGTHYSATLE